MPFVFSCDGHVVEPGDLFDKGLPPSLRRFGMRTEIADGMMTSFAGDNVTMRRPLDSGPPRLGPDGEPFGRPNRAGNRDLEARKLDMELDGVDAEILFPSLGLSCFMIEHAEAELASAQLYNDWHHALAKDHGDTFVRCGLVPIRDTTNAVSEIERLASLGFTAAMIPSLIDPLSGLPQYTSETWDPVFDAAQRCNMVFALHTGTGRYDVRSFRGPGGAVMNYGIQSCDGWVSIMALVAGGVLDRFPKVHVAVIEGGASWLAPLAERMDEVTIAHDPFVRPRLSLMPSEIIKRQVHCEFQSDRAAILSRSVTGTAALLWGADYPHHEGTFPNSRKVVAGLFEGIDIGEREQADILGGNAARLFRLDRPEFAPELAAA
jgi:predicted TIM-barrel fold metal-dependent hydrolase